jgi:hypothetical protein
MTRAQSRLLISWCICIAPLSLIFAASDKVAVRVCATAIAFGYEAVESKWLGETHRNVPTLAQFYAGSPRWQRVALLYGFVLAAMAVFMLTIADGFSRYVGSHVLVFLSAIVLPLVVFLIHHHRWCFVPWAKERPNHAFNRTAQYGASIRRASVAASRLTWSR